MLVQNTAGLQRSVGTDRGSLLTLDRPTYVACHHNWEAGRVKNFPVRIAIFLPSCSLTEWLPVRQ